MMSDHNDSPPVREREHGVESEPLDRLFRFAGRRPAAPEHVVQEVKRVTRPAWQAKVQAVAQARRRRRLWTLAAAVLLVSAGLLLLRLSPAPVAPARVATVELTAGTVGASSAAGGVTIGTELDAGSVIETGAGSFATLRLAGGTSARLDAGTVLRLASASALELERGAVYLDTGTVAGTTLEVVTPYGVARDIGTQFEVRVLEGALEIRVREGEVELDLGTAAHTAAAGVGLTLAGGEVVRETIPPHGPAWGWILQTSPPFELDGRTLGEFLDWVSRETGWQILFADAGLEREVRDTVVRGSITGVRPDQALDLVLPSSGLRYRLEDGTAVIEQAGTG